MLDVVVLVVVSLGLLGLWRLLRAGRTPAQWALLLLLPVPLIYAFARWNGSYLYAWYLIGFLPSAASFVHG